MHTIMHAITFELDALPCDPGDLLDWIRNLSALCAGQLVVRDVLQVVTPNERLAQLLAILKEELLAERPAAPETAATDPPAADPPAPVAYPSRAETVTRAQVPLIYVVKAAPAASPAAEGAEQAGLPAGGAKQCLCGEWFTPRSENQVCASGHKTCYRKAYYQRERGGKKGRNGTETPGTAPPLDTAPPAPKEDAHLARWQTPLGDYDHDAFCRRLRGGDFPAGALVTDQRSGRLYEVIIGRGYKFTLQPRQEPT